MTASPGLRFFLLAMADSGFDNVKLLSWSHGYPNKHVGKQVECRPAKAVERSGISGKMKRATCASPLLSLITWRKGDITSL